MEQKEIKVNKNGKVKVYWSDYPENYSRESRNRVKKYFSSKYGIAPQNINVIYKPSKRNSSGELVEIDGANIESIMSTEYQRKLFKEWLTREGKEGVNFDKVLALDDKVNNEMDIESENDSHKKYRLKWLKVNNFLSYGENNEFPVDRFKGFTVVNSNPANQGGKTSITIDAVKFLFFGKTTKTDTNEQVFNQFNDATELIVKGLIEIEGGEELIIERKLERKPKRKGGWNISNKVNYYKVMPDGEEESLNDEDAIKTTQMIKNIVGNESDFDLVVLATSRNLDTLIDSTAGESGKLLTRFIGLEPIAIKEKISREMYNSFSKSMKGNIYDIETLKGEIKNHQSNLKMLNSSKETYDNELIKESNNYKALTEQKIVKVSSKDKIDSEILSLNPSKLEGEIKTITEKGLKHKKDIEVINNELKKIGDIDFDEDKDFKLTKNKEKLTKVINLGEAEVIRLKTTIKNLIKSGICQACNRKLDDVDNTEHIKQHNTEIDEQNKIIESSKTKLETVNTELAKLSNAKKLIDSKNSLELKRDRLSVDIDSLRNEIKDKRLDLKKYKDNLESIEKNKKIDTDISLIDTKIIISENTKAKLNSQLQTNAIEIDSKFIEAYDNLVLVSQSLKDYKTGILAITKLIEFNPDFRNFFRRGLIKYRMGDMVGACKDANKSKKLNPNFSLVNQLIKNSCN